jgi:DNA-binding transcriptional regulator GbsR (MarR family)
LSISELPYLIQKSLKARNARLILYYIARGLRSGRYAGRSGATPAELIQKTGLSRKVVFLRLREFVEYGLVTKRYNVQTSQLVYEIVGENPKFNKALRPHKKLPGDIQQLLQQREQLRTEIAKAFEKAGAKLTRTEIIQKLRVLDETHEQLAEKRAWKSINH